MIINILKRCLQLLVLVAVGYLSFKFLNVGHLLYDKYLVNKVPPIEQEAGIWLRDYRLEAGPIELKDAGDQVSGVTWSPINDRLYMVGRGDVVYVLEYTREGELVRKIPGDRSMDVEGIAWAGDNNFAIVDERGMTVFIVEIRSDTEKISFDNVPHFSYQAEGTGSNKGFEGVAYNPVTKDLYVVKERSPLAVYRIDGLASADTQISLVREDKMTDSLAFYSRDLSGLKFDPKTGHFLVLSDESKVVTELDERGNVVSILGLNSGLNDLKESIDQAEGVTMDEDGTIYIVGEPNHLYIYGKVAD